MLVKKLLGRRLADKVGEVPLSLVLEDPTAYGLTGRETQKLDALREAAVEITAPGNLLTGKPFRSSRDIFDHFGPRMQHLGVEQFWVVLLDGKHRVRKEIMVSQGTLTSSPVHPREVFRPAIRYGAAAVVLVHNHPSGDPSPSADDLDITRRLADVGDLVGIRVLDHVVIGDGAFASMADRGLL